MIKNLNQIKIDNSEQRARNILQKMLELPQYEMYINIGEFIYKDAIFSINELIKTNKGYWCVEIKSPEMLPITDKILHRMHLWNQGEDKFYKIAQKQGG